MREQRTLSPLASALTRFAPASPLDSALTKNIPGGGGPPCDRMLSTLTLDFQLLPLTPLTSILTNFASASPLTSTLTKTKDLKSFIINTYKKRGVASVLCESRFHREGQPSVTCFPAHASAYRTLRHSGRMPAPLANVLGKN